ncbi:MAG: peptide ABC transporter substrate-binding protein [Cellulosilyticaceae bacterium]
MRKRRWWGIVSFMVLMALLVGCGQIPEETNTLPPMPVEQEKELVNTKIEKNSMTVSMRNAETLHPIYNMEKSVEQTLHLIFNTLVNVEPDGQISPNIAKSWTLDPQSNTLTLKLTEGILWHDGKTLSADDVAFTIETIKGAAESPYKKAVTNIANVQVVDPLTLTISYRQAFSGIYQSLFFPIIPKHIYNVEASVAKDLMPVGSGPYKFESMVPLKTLELVKNDQYFKGAPEIPFVHVMLIPDQESSLHAFEQNLIDVIYTDVMDWGKYAKDKSAQIYEIPSNNYEFMAVNFNRPKFQNANIRQAMLYSLDRQELINIYYLGNGSVTDTPISPNSFLYDRTLMIKEHDEEKAKFLLAQEGYQFDERTKLFTKNDMPLSFTLLVNEENKERIKVAEGMKKMYQEVGIEVAIEVVPQTTYMERIYNKQYDAFLGGWKLSYIPDLSFAFHSSQITSGDNFISYKDSKMDQLLQEAFVATPIQMEDAYSKLQLYFWEQNPYISLYFRNSALITKRQITGNIEPDPLNCYANVEKWTIDNK